VTTSARERLSPSEIVISVPSEASAAGTHAIPMTRSSCGDQRDEVTRPTAAPPGPRTAAPSVGARPLSAVKPTSAVSSSCSP
jgi:hypothetical protein